LKRDVTRFLLVGCTTIPEVQAHVEALVKQVEVCAAAILALDVKLDLDAEVKAQLVVKIVDLITVRPTSLPALVDSSDMANR
jgi:hypothetical protein